MYYLIFCGVCVCVCVISALALTQETVSSDSISYPSRLLKVFSRPQQAATLIPQIA